MNIGIVGLGLIGGSLGRAIVNKTSDKVYAFDVDKNALTYGKLLKAYHFELNKENAKDLDIIFFSLYPNALEKALIEYCPYLKDGCLVVDCCGNKRRIVKQMASLSKEHKTLEFVSAHPMAGREFSGVNHSTLNLFDKASMILVNVNAGLKTLAMIKSYSLSLGFGEVVITSADKHDEVIAFTSQLAHLVSSSYIKSNRASEYLGFSAGSFRDMTRVARLSSQMWAELTIDNADYLVEELESFIAHLEEYKTALENKDAKKMQELLEDGNQRKLLSEKMRRERNNAK